MSTSPAPRPSADVRRGLARDAFSVYAIDPATADVAAVAALFADTPDPRGFLGSVFGEHVAANPATFGETLAFRDAIAAALPAAGPATSAASPTDRADLLATYATRLIEQAGSIMDEARAIDASYVPRIDAELPSKLAQLLEKVAAATDQPTGPAREQRRASEPSDYVPGAVFTHRDKEGAVHELIVEESKVMGNSVLLGGTLNGSPFIGSPSKAVVALGVPNQSGYVYWAKA
jgi:hypothetical protein